MSELLKQLAAHIRSSLDPDLHVVTGRDAPGDELPADLQPSVVKSEPVEPVGTAVAVGVPALGRLAYFVDGIQRQKPLLFASGIPVVYGYTAAAIRARDGNRKMRCHAHKAGDALYSAWDLPGLQKLKTSALSVRDVGTPDAVHPLLLLDAARKRVSDDRGRLEHHLASEWMKHFSGRGEWLVVDGSLAADCAQSETPNVIGVVKSHQTQYFEWEDQRRILALRPGERSGVFIPGGRNRPEVYSWYLRLHDCQGRDLYFGLIRVEAPKCQRTLDMADEISRWLLAERCPLSLPDARWDKMIYPIYDCEQYLKSLAPTWTLIEATMIGLAA